VPALARNRVVPARSAGAFWHAAGFSGLPAAAAKMSAAWPLDPAMIK